MLEIIKERIIESDIFAQDLRIVLDILKEVENEELKQELEIVREVIDKWEIEMDSERAICAKDTSNNSA